MPSGLDKIVQDNPGLKPTADKLAKTVSVVRGRKSHVAVKAARTAKARRSR